ncbi:hypothetical protein FOZ62_026135 [Perkinsus olseni]|uniref:Lysophosphatidylcholine acyltransferase 2 n=1 Tax=Perkinsus olseni TaxID=32597 RepID=A0A7J6QWW5_PEROL|nr:hypothetical protein FOZ62_026135 [Perkinsus olseni]
MLVFEAVGTETISTAVKAAAAAMKLADEQKPIEMEITGPTEEIAKSMGAFAKRNSWVTLHKTRRCSETRDDTTAPPRLTASAESDRVKLAGAISLSLREHPCVEIQGIGPLCVRKIVEALEIAGVQCDDGNGQHIRSSARFENLPCKKGVSDEYLRLTMVSAVGMSRSAELSLAVGAAWHLTPPFSIMSANIRILILLNLARLSFLSRPTVRYRSQLLYSPLRDKVGHYRIRESDKSKIPDLVDLTMVIDIPSPQIVVPLVDMNFTHSEGTSYLVGTMSFVGASNKGQPLLGRLADDFGGDCWGLGGSQSGPSPARIAAMGEHLVKINPGKEMKEVSRAFRPSLAGAWLSTTLMCPEDDGTISLGFCKLHKYNKRYERSDFIFVTMEPSTGDDTTGERYRQHRVAPVASTSPEGRNRELPAAETMPVSADSTVARKRQGGAEQVEAPSQKVARAQGLGHTWRGHFWNESEALQVDPSQDADAPRRLRNLDEPESNRTPKYKTKFGKTYFAPISKDAVE